MIPFVRCGQIAPLSWRASFVACGLAACGLAACGDDSSPATDAGADAARADAASIDGGGALDAGAADAGGMDAGPRVDAWADDGSGDVGPAFDGGTDAGGSGDAGGGVCTGNRLRTVRATSVELIDPTDTLITTRTFRARFGYFLGCSERRAMPLVEVDEALHEVRVTLRVFELEGLGCAAPDVPDERIVSIRVPSSGGWAIRDASASDAPRVDVFVDDPPLAAACGDHGMTDCLEDCDCAAPAACLTGYGFGGMPFRQCAQPCEEKLDCTSGGICASTSDGLDSYCDDAFPQCDATSPCPSGWTCTSGSCVPSFRLAAATRHSCSCDAECDAPLRCVRPASGMGTMGVCESICATGGAWCQGPHFCAEASMDVASLAVSGSVCVWAGE